MAIIEKRKYVLCEDGFANLYQDGKACGFQIRMRIPEYRGVPLALIGGVKVFIDGEECPEEMIRITCEEETFDLQEIATVTNIYWHCQEPAVISVLNGTGLTAGDHTVGAYVSVRISYMPDAFYQGEEKVLRLEEVPCSASPEAEG